MTAFSRLSTAISSALCMVLIASGVLAALGGCDSDSQDIAARAAVVKWMPSGLAQALPTLRIAGDRGVELGGDLTTVVRLVGPVVVAQHDATQDSLSPMRGLRMRDQPLEIRVLGKTRSGEFFSARYVYEPTPAGTCWSKPAECSNLVDSRIIGRAEAQALYVRSADFSPARFTKLFSAGGARKEAV